MTDHRLRRVNGLFGADESSYCSSQFDAQIHRSRDTRAQKRFTKPPFSRSFDATDRKIQDSRVYASGMTDGKDD
jgi:hypothetical protein